MFSEMGKAAAALTIGGAALLGGTATAMGQEPTVNRPPTEFAGFVIGDEAVGKHLQKAERKAARAALIDNMDDVVAQGPSKWRGEKLRHPAGGKFNPSVERWANLVSDAMVELDIPEKYLPGILAQVQQESNGDPKARNNWDSNAAAGDPSKGLLQIIGSTYDSYAKKGYGDRKYQTTPYTNVYASLNYVLDSYGMGKFASWNGGANQGY